MSAKANLRPLRILVVEDHADTRMVLKMYLEYLGHVVRMAASKAEALAEAAARPCDVLLVDIGLSDGNGWEVLQQARFIHPSYAIAMSGRGLAADREKSIKAGFRNHLQKPFDVDLLHDMLQEAMRETAPDAVSEPHSVPSLA